MTRGVLRENMNVIRAATVKKLESDGHDRHTIAVTLGITDNEVALYERMSR